MRPRFSIARCCCPPGPEQGTPARGQYAGDLSAEFSADGFLTIAQMAKAMSVRMASGGELTVTGSLSKRLPWTLNAAGVLGAKPAEGYLDRFARVVLDAAGTLEPLTPVDGVMQRQMAVDVIADGTLGPVPPEGTLDLQLGLDVDAAGFISSASMGRSLGLAFDGSGYIASGGTLQKQLGLDLDAAGFLTPEPIPDVCLYSDKFDSLNSEWRFSNQPWFVTSGRLYVAQPTAEKLAYRKVEGLYPYADSVTQAVTFDPTEGGEFTLFYDLGDNNWATGRIYDDAGQWKLYAEQKDRSGLRDSSAQITDIPTPTGPGTLSVAWTKTEDRAFYAIYQLQWSWNGSQVWFQSGIELAWNGQAQHGVIWQPGSNATAAPWIDDYWISGVPCLPTDATCGACSGEIPENPTLDVSGVVAAGCPDAGAYNRIYSLTQQSDATCLGWSARIPACSQEDPRAEVYVETLGSEDRYIVRFYSGSGGDQVVFESRPVPTGTLLCCEGPAFFPRLAEPDWTTALGADWTNAAVFVDPKCQEPAPGNGQMVLSTRLNAAGYVGDDTGDAEGTLLFRMLSRVAGNGVLAAGVVTGTLRKQMTADVSAAGFVASEDATGTLVLQLGSRLDATGYVQSPDANGNLRRQLTSDVSAAGALTPLDVSGALELQLASDVSGTGFIESPDANGNLLRQMSADVAATGELAPVPASGTLQRQLGVDLNAGGKVSSVLAQGTLRRQLAADVSGSGSLGVSGDMKRQLGTSFKASGLFINGQLELNLQCGLIASGQLGGLCRRSVLDNFTRQEDWWTGTSGWRWESGVLKPPIGGADSTICIPDCCLNGKQTEPVQLRYRIEMRPNAETDQMGFQVLMSSGNFIRGFVGQNRLGVWQGTPDHFQVGVQHNDLLGGELESVNEDPSSTQPRRCQLVLSLCPAGGALDDQYDYDLWFRDQFGNNINSGVGFSGIRFRYDDPFTICLWHYSSTGDSNAEFLFLDSAWCGGDDCATYPANPDCS